MSERSRSSSSSPPRRQVEFRSSRYEISPLRFKRTRRERSPSPRRRSRSPSLDVVRPTLPPAMRPSHTVTTAMLDSEDDSASTPSMPAAESVLPQSQRDVIFQAWDVIKRRARSIDFPLPDVASFSLDLSTDRVDASSMDTDRPCGSTLRRMVDVCASAPMTPAVLESGLVSNSTLKKNFKGYASTSGPVSFATPRASTSPQLSNSVQKLELTFAQYKQFVAKGDNFLAASNYVQLLSDAIAVLGDLDHWDASARADVHCLTRALSLVSRDLCALSAANAVSLRLIHRDALLAKSTLPEQFRSKCRHTIVHPKKVFGPEADLIIDEFQSSPAVLLDKVLQKKSSRAQEPQLKRRRTYQPPESRWRRDPREPQRRQTQRSYRRQRKTSSAPSASVSKQSS